MQDDRNFAGIESTSTPLRTQTSPLQRILVVDHDPYTCHLSTNVLIRQGYEVDTAEDGAAGWEELQARNYHLLITEHELPKLTGIALVKKLRAARMALPVVMAAGRLPTCKLARNPSLHLAATLVKPFDVDALLITVHNVLCAPQPSHGQIEPPPYWQCRPADGAESLRRYTGYRCRGIASL